MSVYMLIYLEQDTSIGTKVNIDVLDYQLYSWSQ